VGASVERPGRRLRHQGPRQTVSQQSAYSLQMIWLLIDETRYQFIARSVSGGDADVFGSVREAGRGDQGRSLQSLRRGGGPVTS
jgi:hypothetical protein